MISRKRSINNTTILQTKNNNTLQHIKPNSNFMLQMRATRMCKWKYCNYFRNNYATHKNIFIKFRHLLQLRRTHITIPCRYKPSNRYNPSRVKCLRRCSYYSKPSFFSKTITLKCKSNLFNYKSAIVFAESVPVILNTSNVVNFKPKTAIVFFRKSWKRNNNNIFRPMFIPKMSTLLYIFRKVIFLRFLKNLIYQRNYVLVVAKAFVGLFSSFSIVSFPQRVLTYPLFTTQRKMRQFLYLKAIKYTHSEQLGVIGRLRTASFYRRNFFSPCKIVTLVNLRGVILRQRRRPGHLFLLKRRFYWRRQRRPYFSYIYNHMRRRRSVPRRRLLKKIVLAKIVKRRFVRTLQFKRFKFYAQSTRAFSSSYDKKFLFSIRRLGAKDSAVNGLSRVYWLYMYQRVRAVRRLFVRRDYRRRRRWSKGRRRFMQKLNYKRCCKFYKRLWRKRYRGTRANEYLPAVSIQRFVYKVERRISKLKKVLHHNVLSPHKLKFMYYRRKTSALRRALRRRRRLYGLVRKNKVVRRKVLKKRVRRTKKKRRRRKRVVRRQRRLWRIRRRCRRFSGRWELRLLCFLRASIRSRLRIFRVRRAFYRRRRKRYHNFYKRCRQRRARYRRIKKPHRRNTFIRWQQQNTRHKKYVKRQKFLKRLKGSKYFKRKTPRKFRYASKYRRPGRYRRFKRKIRRRRRLRRRHKKIKRFLRRKHMHRRHRRFRLRKNWSRRILRLTQARRCYYKKRRRRLRSSVFVQNSKWRTRTVAFLLRRISRYHFDTASSFVKLVPYNPTLNIARVHGRMLPRHLKYFARFNFKRQRLVRRSRVKLAFRVRRPKNYVIARYFHCIHLIQKREFHRGRLLLWKPLLNRVGSLTIQRFGKTSELQRLAAYYVMQQKHYDKSVVLTKPVINVNTKRKLFVKKKLQYEQRRLELQRRRQERHYNFFLNLSSRFRSHFCDKILYILQNKPFIVPIKIERIRQKRLKKKKKKKYKTQAEAISAVIAKVIRKKI